MIETIIFIFGSLFIIWISVPSLHRPGSHGYYRFFAWEIILGLFVANLHDWFVNPYAWNQIISWILLLVSLIPLILGVIQMRTIGRPSDGLEATTQLVKTGIFRFIRHPMYASLLYLAWGIYFKSPSLLDGCLVIVTSVFPLCHGGCRRGRVFDKIRKSIQGLHAAHKKVPTVHFLKIWKMLMPFGCLFKGISSL